MSELTGKIEKFDSLVLWGVPEDAAAARVGLPLEQILRTKGLEEEYRNREAAIDSGLVQEYDGIITPDYTTFRNQYMNQGDLMRMRGVDPQELASDEAPYVAPTVEEGAAWWRHVFNVAHKGIIHIGGTAAIPQSMLFHTLIDQDWRHAIPPYLAPDEWDDDPEKAFKFVSFSDVISHTKLLGEGSSMFASMTSDALMMPSEEREALGFSTGLGTATDMLSSAVLDGLTDPLTYVSGAGIAGKAVTLARKAAPLSVRATALSNIAQKSGNLIDLMEASEELGKLRKAIAVDTKAGKFSVADGLSKFKKAGDAKRLVDAEIKIRGGAGTEIVSESLPMARPQDISTKGTSGLRKKILTARKEALKDGWAKVIRPNPEHMDDVALANFIKTGQDQGSQLAEMAGRIAAGADDADLAVNVRQQLNPTRSSTNIHYASQGADGRILDTRQYLDSVISKVQKHQDVLLNRIDELASVEKNIKGYQKDVVSVIQAEIDDLQRALGKLPSPPPGVPKKALSPKGLEDYSAWLKAKDKIKELEALRKKVESKGISAARKSDLEKAGVPEIAINDKARKSEIGRLSSSVKRSQRHIEHMQKEGKVPNLPETAVPEGKSPRRLLPTGARRELLDSADFARSQFGEGWYKFVQRGLYPKSWIPRPAWLIGADKIFRQTSTVMQKYAPQAYKRAMGAIRDADIDVTRKVGAFDAILTEAGILRRKSGPIGKAQQAFGLDHVGRSIGADKKSQELLFDLLDNPRNSDEWVDLAANASPKLCEHTTPFGQ
jgi:hypothetical protein